MSVDDAVYHAARVAAAQNRTNVSALVRNYLTAMAKGKAPALLNDAETGDGKDREELVRLFRDAKLVLGCKPSREKTYER